MGRAQGAVARPPDARRPAVAPRKKDVKKKRSSGERSGEPRATPTSGRTDTELTGKSAAAAAAAAAAAVLK